MFIPREFALAIALLGGKHNIALLCSFPSGMTFV